MTATQAAPNNTLLLTSEEIEEVTGRKQSSAQLAELRRQGFHRARRNPAGRIVLEREHYIAVCAGLTPVTAATRLTKTHEPQLQ